MKKSIIAASAASVALAAMPVVGAFAAASDITQAQDTLNITVGSSCTFDTTNATNEYTASLAANELKIFTEKSTELKVTCNNTTGYTVKGAFIDLAGQTSGNEDKIAFATSAPAAGSGTWAAKLTATAIGATNATPNTYLSNNGTVITSGVQSGTTGRSYDSATIQYAVSTGSQKADTYTGTATYTFASN